MGSCKSNLLSCEEPAKEEFGLTDTCSSQSSTSKLPSKYRTLTIATEEKETGFRKSTPNFGLDLKRAVDPDSDVKPFTRAYNLGFNIEYTHSRLREILHIKQLMDEEVLPEDS